MTCRLFHSSMAKQGVEMNSQNLTDERLEQFIAEMTECAVNCHGHGYEENAAEYRELVSALTELRVCRKKQKEHGWIDFNESVPDELTPVIVMYADGQKWAGIWSSSGERWDDGLDSDEVINITHWQPMPPTPEQW